MPQPPHQVSKVLKGDIPGPTRDKILVGSKLITGQSPAEGTQPVASREGPKKMIATLPSPKTPVGSTFIPQDKTVSPHVVETIIQVEPSPSKVQFSDASSPTANHLTPK